MKNENLHARLAELRAERGDIDAKCVELEAERDTLLDVEMKATAARRAVGDKIAALKNGHYRAVCNEIAALVRALGAKSIAAESGAYGVEGQPIGGK